MMASLLILADASLSGGLSWEAIAVIAAVVAVPVGGIYVLLFRISNKVSALETLVSTTQSDAARNREDHGGIYRRLNDHEVATASHEQRLDDHERRISKLESCEWPRSQHDNQRH